MKNIFFLNFISYKIFLKIILKLMSLKNKLNFPFFMFYYNKVENINLSIIINGIRIINVGFKPAKVKEWIEQL